MRAHAAGLAYGLAVAAAAIYAATFLGGVTVTGSLVAFAIGVVLLDLGIQGTHISNQSEVYRLSAEARSRLTTGYMASYFFGGACGSASSAVAYGMGGWPAVVALGSAVSILCAVIWAVTELRLPLREMKHGA